MRPTIFAGIALCALAAGPLHANPFETSLPNGMRVIVKEDRRAPSIVHMVWYKVGAIDEVDGTSGVAHVLEHMMFKGCLLYTSPSPRDRTRSRMPSSA